MMKATSQTSGNALTSGNAPMNDEQAACLRSLSEQALEPDAFNRNLDAAEAARGIAALQAKLALLDGPPHTL